MPQKQCLWRYIVRTMNPSQRVVTVTGGSAYTRASKMAEKDSSGNGTEACLPFAIIVFKRLGEFGHKVLQ